MRPPLDRQYHRREGDSIIYQNIKMSEKLRKQRTFKCSALTESTAEREVETSHGVQAPFCWWRRNGSSQCQEICARKAFFIRMLVLFYYSYIISHNASLCCLGKITVMNSKSNQGNVTLLHHVTKWWYMCCNKHKQFSVAVHNVFCKSCISPQWSCSWLWKS